MAEQIRNELNSRWWVSNAKLEGYWARIGLDLPEALESPEYRELWRRSVNDEKIDVRKATAPLVRAFRQDTIRTAKSVLSSQSTRLANLRDELHRAAEAPKVSAPGPDKSTIGGVEDSARQMSRETGPKPIVNVGGLIDSATLLDFLVNWKAKLASCRVGLKMPDTTLLPVPGATPAPKPFAPFPNAPGAPADVAPTPSLAINFKPGMTVDALLAAPDVAAVDVAALDAVATTHQRCTENEGLLKELAGRMLAEDANLAILNEKGLLSDVSALSERGPEQAVQALRQHVTETLKAMDKCLGAVGDPDFDWRILTEAQGLLLAGAEAGSRNWASPAGKGDNKPDGSARGLVNSYLDAQAKAEADEARTKFLLSVGFTVVGFAAMFTPAAPLAAAMLGASNAYFAASAVGGIADAARTKREADQTATAADAGMATKQAAKDAKAEADEKNSALAVDLMMAALPYMPAVLKGAGSAAAAIGGELRLSKFAERVARLHGATDPFTMAGALTADVVVDLAKAGLSAIARGRVGGELSSVEMLSKVKPINRTIEWVDVSAALDRAGMEKQLTAGSKYGLKGYVRYHIHGPGTGFEGFPIMMAPERANQFANGYIEDVMREAFKNGAQVRFRTSYTTFGGDELRVFVEGMLNSRDKAILRRLALDYGRIEKFLKSITYDIEFTRAGKVELYRAHIAVGAPGTSIQPTLMKPTLVSSKPVP